MSAAKKVVILGGGIAGLTAGIYARRAGYAAEIYEKNALPGGECTGWDREGYHIDNCVHWLMGGRPGSDLHRLWLTVGAITPDSPLLLPERMYTSELRGARLSLWRDDARTQRELLALSPNDAPAIRALLRSVRIASRVQIPAAIPPELFTPADGLRTALSSAPILRLNREYAGIDTQDLANRFRHPLIRCLLSDFCPKESTGSSFPLAYGSFIAGDGGVPKGGSRALALRMQARFEALGGRFFAKKEAVGLVRSGRRVQALRFADGTSAAGDFFILSCDPAVIFPRLLPESAKPAALRALYEDPAAYPLFGMFQAAFAVDSPVDALGGEVVLDCSTLRTAEWMGDRATYFTFSREPAFAPEGKQILQALLPLRGESWEFWRTLGKDPAAYKAEKERIAGRLRLLAEARFAEYRGRLRLLDSWTPLSYARCCGAYRGANQSFTITKYGGYPAPSPYPGGVENAVLAGQWLSPPGGVPGAAIQGKYAVQRLLAKEKKPFKL